LQQKKTKAQQKPRKAKKNPYRFTKPESKGKKKTHPVEDESNNKNGKQKRQVINKERGGGNEQ